MWFGRTKGIENKKDVRALSSGTFQTSTPEETIKNEVLNWDYKAVDVTKGKAGAT